MRWMLVGLSVLGILVACGVDPIASRTTNNPQVTVDLLFEHDGCKVYRFTDHGHAHYYARCGNHVRVSSSHTENDDTKNARTVVEEIPTEEL